MIPWESFRGLSVGERTRADHGCGPGRTLLVSRNSWGYRAWCFRCNEGWSHKGEQESLAEKLSRWRDARREDRRAQGTSLPEPRVYDHGEWPLEARLWLYRAGLGRAEGGTLGVYYHPPTNRVVLPVLGPTGAVLFWQARSVDGRKPKYLSPEVPRDSLVPVYGEGKVVLVEDLLSAVKISLSGAQGVCLLGTRLTAGTTAYAMKHRDVSVWLDSDPPGRKAARLLGQQLRSYGLKVRDLCTPLDPKLHSRGCIKRIIYGP